jgi:hypothetical protein
MVYVPVGVFAANVKTPSESILNGPVVTGVTSVLAAVTKMPFKVSFVVTVPTVVTLVDAGTFYVGSSFARIGFNTTTVAIAVSQFAGLAPTSHNS